jgi:hypothetical protein
MVQRAIVADMELHTTTTRQGLGGLLLPWCVDTRDRTCPIRINDVRDLIPHALQLRVWDVVQEDILIALGRQDAEGGDSLEKIQSIRTEATRSGRLPAIEDSKACRVRNGLMLMEGCHRSCALYLLGPPKFELRSVVVAVGSGWAVYDDPRLRVSRAESERGALGA